MENEISDWRGRLPAVDDNAASAARQRWNAVAKPANSLGLLEDAVVRIARLTGNPRYRLDKRAVLVLCADNGVVRQGVANTGSEVTAVLARCLADNAISVCKMAAVARADVIGVDMGMNVDLGLPALLNRRVASGTADMAVGPAMSREQALEAISHGVRLAEDCVDRGYSILATGEVGIGNTTTSSAIASVLLGQPASAMTGRGSGLPAEALPHKAAVIEKAIAVNQPDPDDALDVLAKLGGFDIAGMAGIFIGGAIRRTPVVMDGLISSVAALVATRLCPGVEAAILPSHVSAEPAAAAVLGELRLEPLVTAGMHLGEGTGAVAVIPLLDMAYAVYHDMPTYGDLAIGKYQPKDT